MAESPKLLRFHREWVAEAPQAMFGPIFPHGWWYYLRACDVVELTGEVIDITVDHAARIHSPLTVFPIWHLGGAMACVSEDETVFNGRTAGHTFNISAATRTADGFDEDGTGCAPSGRLLRPTTPAST